MYDYINNLIHYTNWPETNLNTSTMYSGTNWIYIDYNGNVLVSQSEPNYYSNIILGFAYIVGPEKKIETVFNCGMYGGGFGTRVGEALRHLGPYVHDNGLAITLNPLDYRKIICSAGQVQNSLINFVIDSKTSDDAGHEYGDFIAWFGAGDNNWLIDYDFAYREEGRIPNNRYNDTTRSGIINTGATGTTSSGSYLITSTTNLSSMINTFDLVQLGITDETAATLVSGVEWTGSQTNINLIYPYSGNNTNDTIYITSGLAPLDPDKYAKHLLLATLDNQLHFIYSQHQYDSEDDARAADLPAIPDGINKNSVDVAYIIVGSGIDNLEGHVYDIRPRPFIYTADGSGGGSAASDHGALIGLDDDDHPQYSLVNGSRDYNGIVSYDSPKIFTQDEQIIDKKYVDDEITYATMGIDADNNISDGTSSTSSTTYQTKVSITVPAYTGTVRVGWSMGYNADANNKDVYVRTYNVTDAVVLAENNQQTNNSLNWWTFAGFAYVTFTGAAKTFSIQYRAGTADCSVRNARLEAWKVY